MSSIRQHDIAAIRFYEADADLAQVEANISRLRLATSRWLTDYFPAADAEGFAGVHSADTEMRARYHSAREALRGVRRTYRHQLARLDRCLAAISACRAEVQAATPERLITNYEAPWAPYPSTDPYENEPEIEG